MRRHPLLLFLLLLAIPATAQFPNAEGLSDTFQTLVYQAITR